MTNKQKLWIMVGLTVVTLLGTILAVILLANEPTSSGGTTDSSSYVPFIPIFGGAFVPIIAATSNSQEKIKPDMKWKMAMLVGIVLVLVLGVLLFGFLR